MVSFLSYSAFLCTALTHINQYARSDVVTGLSSAVMAEACATSEEAEEADFRDWADVE